jgi:hypothetical protein
MAEHRKDRRRPDPTAQLTPNRGGDFVEDDVTLSDSVPDAGSHQGNHGNTGTGGDDERGDADDAKVTGQSRD